MIDIIIPTYNNIEKLRKTINSIPQHEDITITIVDDCSQGMDYSEFRGRVDKILLLQENCGPGVARQIGLDNTSNPYVLFLDSGDRLINFNVIDKIVKVLLTNTKINVFSWDYASEKNLTQGIKKTNRNRLHGYVYKRAFLECYDICFCHEGSRANEDVGFNNAIQLIQEQNNEDIYISDDIIIVWEQDPLSITHENNFAFIYKQQNKGLAINEIHALRIAEKNGVSKEIITKHSDKIMISIYYFFLKTWQRRDEFTKEAWEGAKYYWDNWYKNHNNSNTEQFSDIYSAYIPTFKKDAKKWTKPYVLNIKKFLRELQNDNIPNYYLEVNND